MKEELKTAFNDRDFLLAERLANEELQANPSNARLWGFLGLSLYHRTKFRGAVT